MREYARVYSSFWTGQTGKKLRSCGYESRIIALYVLTSPHANMIGLYYLPIPYISYETAISEEGASKALRSLGTIGFCFYDDESEFVWVPEMARYQIGKQLKPNDKQVKGIINLYNSLQNNPFLPEFYDQYKDAFHLTERRGFEGASKALRSNAMQCKEQEQ